MIHTYATLDLQMVQLVGQIVIAALVLANTALVTITNARAKHIGRQAAIAASESKTVALATTTTLSEVKGLVNGRLDNALKHIAELEAKLDTQARETRRAKRRSTNPPKGDS